MPEKGFLERKTLSQVLESITLCQHCQHFFWMPYFPKTAAVSTPSNSSQSTLLLLPCPPKSPFKRKELGRSFRGYLAEVSPIYSLFHCHAFEKHTLNLQQKSGNIRMQKIYTCRLGSFEGPMNMEEQMLQGITIWIHSMHNAIQNCCLWWLCHFCENKTCSKWARIALFKYFRNAKLPQW